MNPFSTYKFIPTILIALLLFALAACTPQPDEPPTPPVVTSAPTTDWFQVYFTDPASPDAKYYSGGPDEALAAAIHSARLSVDMAVYSLNLWSIRDALLDAYHRGVNVRMVMESDNMDSDEAQELIAAGIPILGDRREGLMHDKFVVIDRQEVWSGSMNFTTGGAYKDDNNLIRIRSVEVALDYTTEFEEMFVADKFGPATLIPYPNLTIDSTPAEHSLSLEIYFSPDDGVAARLVELIQSAQESIYFLAYSFTSNDIGAAMRERAGAGVTVAGVMDAGQVNSNQGSEYDPFRQAGLDVRLDGNAGLMHHKLFIIDGKIVITGSYNFSASAEERNDENVVIIFNPDVAVQYLTEFQRVYAQAQP
ncbi:MAG: phospholipase D-like domain-containing protein [Chloroflexota bacterium]